MSSSALASVTVVESLFDGFPIKEVFGLPLHPLVVHAVVVLLPLASIGLIVMASGIKRSKQYGGLVTLIAGVAMVSAFTAAASGRDLAARLGYGEQDHFTFGQWLQWVAVALFMATLALWLLDKKPSSRGTAGGIVAIVGVVVALIGIAATVYVGHLGADLTWG